MFKIYHKSILLWPHSEAELGNFKPGKMLKLRPFTNQESNTLPYNFFSNN